MQTYSRACLLLDQCEQPMSTLGLNHNSNKIFEVHLPHSSEKHLINFTIHSQIICKTTKQDACSITLVQTSSTLVQTFCKIFCQRSDSNPLPSDLRHLARELPSFQGFESLYYWWPILCGKSVTVDTSNITQSLYIQHSRSPTTSLTASRCQYTKNEVNELMTFFKKDKF